MSQMTQMTLGSNLAESKSWHQSCGRPHPLSQLATFLHTQLNLPPLSPPLNTYLTSGHRAERPSHSVHTLSRFANRYRNSHNSLQSCRPKSGVSQLSLTLAHGLLAATIAKTILRHLRWMFANMVLEEESEEESSSDESVGVKPVVAPRKKFDDEEDSDDVRSLNSVLTGRS